MSSYFQNFVLLSFLMFPLGCTEKPQLNLSPEVQFTPSDAGSSSQSDAGFSLDGGLILDGGRSEDGGVDAGLNLTPPSPACATYMACLLALDPNSLEPEFLDAYGPGGLCWVNGAEAADFCDVQCRTELTQAQEIADIIPECYFPGLLNTDGGTILDAGRIIPDAGRIIPDAGRIIPDAGRIIPDAGRIIPDAGRIIPDAGAQDAGR